MKRFNLKEYLANPKRKVLTREGNPVRILCTDANNPCPIVALVPEKGNIDLVCTFDKDGKFIKGGESKHDLFFDTVKKEGWLNLHRNCMGFIMPGYLYDTEEQALKEIRDKEKHVATIKISWEE